MKDRASKQASDPDVWDLMAYVDGELEADKQQEVEKRLQQDPQALAVVATVLEIGQQIQEVTNERAKRAGADDIANWVMAQIENEKINNVVPIKAPSQSTGPSIWSIAAGALAAAAAIALVVWRFAGAELVQPASSQAMSASATNPEFVIASASLPAVDDDPEPGVFVDMVDFGARTGTIFYVPGDTGTTTVVWLTDDEAGGN